MQCNTTDPTAYLNRSVVKFTRLSFIYIFFVSPEFYGTFEAVLHHKCLTKATAVRHIVRVLLESNITHILNTLGPDNRPARRPLEFKQNSWRKKTQPELRNYAKVYGNFTSSPATDVSHDQNKVCKHLKSENCHTTLFTFSKTVNPPELYFEVA